MDSGLFPYQVIKEIATPTGNWAGPHDPQETGPNATRGDQRRLHCLAFFSWSLFAPSKLSERPLDQLQPSLAEA